MNSQQEREAYILDHPLRIAPVDANGISDQHKAAVADLWSVIGIAPKPELPEYFAIMLNHPELMLSQTHYATQLLNSQLSPRHRQMIICRIAWLCGAPFEWSQHIKNGKAYAGLTTADAEQLTQGSTSEGWSDNDKLIVKAVEELYHDAMISDSTWEGLALFLNEKQLLELPLLAGYYQSVAYLQNSLRCRLMPGSNGLATR